MGYYYGGNSIPDGKAKLYEELREAERRLDSYCRALGSPVGSFAWEGAVHSSDTIESLQENVRKAKGAYLNYNGK